MFFNAPNKKITAKRVQSLRYLTKVGLPTGSGNPITIHAISTHQKIFFYACLFFVQ